MKDAGVKPVPATPPEELVTSTQYPVRVVPVFVCEDTVRLGVAAESLGAPRKANEVVSIRASTPNTRGAGTW